MKKNVKWWARYQWLKVRKVLRALHSGRDSQRVHYPKKVSEEERSALFIWSTLVHQESCELMYDPQTYESYAEYHGPGGPVYLFLESRNLRVVNTVVGYDVRLTQEAEAWASQVFNKEIHKRRSHFKAEVNSKVRHSLEALENRILENIKREI